jgi:hypothetical protein
MSFRHLSGARVLAAIASFPYSPAAHTRAGAQQLSAGDIGQAFITAEVNRYGRVTNAAWNDAVADILGRLQRGTGYTGFRVRFVIIGNRSVNAEAIPGGSIIVNAGLLSFLDSLTSSKASQGQQSEFRAFLAAVLAHELAHITLGHTDSLASRIRRLPGAASDSSSGSGAQLSLVQMIQDSTPTLEEFQQSREREYEADRVGALYLLRAGWTIQTAMDLMRALDSKERQDPSFLTSVTYVRTHPRASSREAALEGFRARLKFLQADYDDALSLIQNNVAVPTAVTLLDTVLVYFPGMVPALHARGTAYHQLWLETVPVPVQRGRASLMTYTFRFLPLMRGVPGDMGLFEAASRDYRSVLTVGPLARTLVQEAQLEAYAGDCAKAQSDAQMAARLDSSSADVANNRGVVQLVCDNPTEALQSFLRAQRAVGRVIIPSLLFNRARAMKESGVAGADELLERYVTIDGTSPWASEARTLLGQTSNSATISTPARSNAGSPAIQGISLGDDVIKVARVFGPMKTVGTDSVTIQEYPARGLRVAASVSAGVVMIVLTTPSAGSIEGVRVGDVWSKLRTTLGVPAEDNDRYTIFARDGWSIAAVQRSGRVGGIGIVLRK